MAMANPMVTPNLRTTVLAVTERIREAQTSKWSDIDMSSRTNQRMKAEMYDLLKACSGGDIVAFLTHVVPVDDLRDLPHGQALQALAEPYNGMDGSTRRPLLVALKESRMCTWPELKRCGFQIQEDQFQRCDKDVFNDGVTGGRPSSALKMKPHIDKLMHESSSPVNTGTCSHVMEGKGGRRSKSAPCRRLESTYRELYSRFDRKDEISYRSFVRNVDSQFLQYSRETDCCDYCVEGRVAEKSLIQHRVQYKEPDLPLTAHPS